MASEQDSRDPLHGDLELPDWASTNALNENRGSKYRDRTFAETFAQVDRPILTASQVAGRVDCSVETARDRLNKLESDGFLEMYELARSDEDSATKIYYLRHPDVRDPIPTELRAEQISDLTRLDELEEELDETKQELEEQTDRADQYEQVLNRIDGVVTTMVATLAVVLAPLAAMSLLSSIPVFFQSLLSLDIVFGVMVVIMGTSYYLVDKQVSGAIDRTSLFEVLGD
jgi:DNA-binding Lrp family transcriptional regulator